MKMDEKKEVERWLAAGVWHRRLDDGTVEREDVMHGERVWRPIPPPGKDHAHGR
jgi:hypothetical protein